MDEIDQTVSFQEGQPCPLPIEGHGGGLSFSSNGEMLLIASVSHPSESQIKAFDGDWKAKLVADQNFLPFLSSLSAARIGCWKHLAIQLNRKKKHRVS